MKAWKETREKVLQENCRLTVEFKEMERMQTRVSWACLYAKKNKYINFMHYRCQVAVILIYSSLIMCFKFTHSAWCKLDTKKYCIYFFDLTFLLHPQGIMVAMAGRMNISGKYHRSLRNGSIPLTVNFKSIILRYN